MILGDERDGKEMIILKRLATGEPISKQVKVDVNRDQVLTNPQNNQTRLVPSMTRLRSITTYRNIAAVTQKKTTIRSNGSRRKSVLEVLGKRVKQYDLLNNLVQA